MQRKYARFPHRNARLLVFIALLLSCAVYLITNKVTRERVSNALSGNDDPISLDTNASDLSRPDFVALLDVPELHITFACDTRSPSQVRTLVAALRSVVSNSKNQDRLTFHFFVRRGDESSMREVVDCASADVPRFRYSIYPVDDDLGFPIKVRMERERRLRTPFNFVRFTLSDRLPSVDKVMYLDTDVIVLGDLAEVYDGHLVEDSNFTVAAARRKWSMGQSINFSVPEVVQAGIRKDAMAFNAGVLLFRLDRWREQNMTQKVKRWMKLNTFKPVYPLGSQPPLQLSVGEAFEIISPQWNVDGAGHSLISTERIKGAKVIHWTGPTKGCERGAYHADIWKKYDIKECFVPVSEFCTPIETEYWNLFDKQEVM